MAEDTSLTAAVTKAVQDTPTEVQEPEQGNSNLEASRNQDGDASNEQGNQPTSESDPQLNLQDIQDAEQGKVLIRALRDPNSSAQVIDFIARQAGYTKIETPIQAKAAARDITSLLEESLGEDFKFLAPKLAPAIQESMKNLLEQQDQGRYQNLQSRVEKQELKDIQTETTRAHVALAQEWFGADDMPSNVIQAMSKAMDEFPPSDPNMSPERYYKRIFQLAAGELGLTKKGGGARSTTSQSDRIARNQNDSTARNLSAQNRGVTPSLDGNPRKLSLKDAVSLAVEQVSQSSRK